MKRYDLRHLHDDFYDRMAELIDEGLKVGEVGIFLFEVRNDFSHVQRTADFIRELGHDLMNSLKFAEPDWTIVVKKVDEATRQARADEIAAAKVKAELEAVEKTEAEKAEKEISEAGKAE